MTTSAWAQKRPKSRYFCAHQIASDKTIILSTENVQKVHSRPKLWGFEQRCGQNGQNALMVALFEQLPQAQIRPKSKNLCTHQIAQSKTFIWSTETVQKVYSWPKLWGFEKKGMAKIGQNVLTGTLFKQLPQSQSGPKLKNFCANEQTVVFSPENVQKVHSRPKLRALEKQFP